jgi:hypothetical protein
MAPVDDDRMSELELQQHLQRFATQFADRVTQATETLERSAPPAARDEALRKSLLYVSSALEIATGPDPEINLLDMIVFVRLSRTALEHHWIPEVYRESGEQLLEVFSRSEQELRAVAEDALTPAQRERLTRLVDAWLEENPTQIRVEGVRLADFSAAAGSAAAERAIEAKGLLSSVTSASHAANQAMLLAERGLFLFHRLPFLWRLQARIAARDMVADAVDRLTEGPQAPLARVKRQARHVVRRASANLAVLAAAGSFLWWLGARARRPA